MQDNTLLGMLKVNAVFKSMDNEEQEIVARLATEFDDNDLALYCSPNELVEKLRVGTTMQWRKFLQLEPVKVYITKRLSEVTAIEGRKALGMLNTGKLDSAGVSAAKEVIKASGILNIQNNRIVILHQVNRPKIKSRKPKPETVEQDVQAIVDKL